MRGCDEEKQQMSAAALKQWLVAAICVAALVPAAPASEPIDAIVAVVNNTPITRVQVMREAARLRRAEVPADEAPQRALNDLIDRTLQLQRATLAGVTLEERVIAQRLAELPAEFGLKDAAALRRAVREEFLMTDEEFRARVREDMSIQALFYREVFLNTEVHEGEIDQFLKLEAGVAPQREYRLRHILLPVATDGADTAAQQQLAADLRQQAQDGADFATLARAHSHGTYAASGGALGYKSERALPSAFIAEVQNLAPGEVSQVIATQRGFHLLKLEAVRGGELSETVRRFRLAHIFMPHGMETLIQQVWRDLETPADFERAVREHSTDEVSQARGGEIGWFGEGDVPAYFATAVRALQPGEFSTPLASPFGWHIVQLMEVGEERVDLAELREQAREILRERRALAQRDIWLQAMRAEAHIRVLDPAFQYTGR